MNKKKIIKKNTAPTMFFSFGFPQRQFFSGECCWSTGKVWIWGLNCGFFLLQEKSFVIGKKNLFWKILVLQHYTCQIYLDLGLNLVFIITQNYPVRRKWNEAAWLDTLLTTCFGIIDYILVPEIDHKGYKKV